MPRSARETSTRRRRRPARTADEDARAAEVAPTPSGRVRNARAARCLETSPVRMPRRAIARMALAVFLVACALASPALALENCGDNVTSFRRWADLRAFRNPPLRGAFCVTRLSKDGVAGCSNDAVTSAPLRRLRPDGSDETIALAGERVLLATPAAWQNLMRKAFASDAAEAKALRSKIKGVFVESVSADIEEERGWAKGYAPGPAHRVNVTGGFVGGVDATGMDLRGVPMMLLDRPSTVLARARAADNAEMESKGASESKLWRVQTDERMAGLGKQPTINPPNSVTCLKAGTCLPIGGYSVVATLPSLSDPSAHRGKSVIILAARMDADGFFRDATPAVNSRMTGLVALMAAATSMKKMYAQLTPEQIKHPVAFVALSGEDFGKLGSDRIMRELVKSPEHSKLPGLAGRKIRAIIELGPLGFSESFVGERTPTIYVHGAHEGNMLRRMQMIANTFDFEETAELGAPKIMETSAPTFSILQADDFESAYLSEDPDAPIDAFGGTFMDAGALRVVNVKRMESVVHVIARLVRQIALTNPDAEPHLDVPASISAVNNLAECLTNDDFGLSACELGNKYLAGDATKRYDEYSGTARLGEYSDPTTLPTRYPETLIGLAADAQSHADKGTLARFVWNYLAEATSSTISPAMCDARGACSNGTACVGHSSKNVGECHATTTKYVVALSTRLSFDHKSQTWSVRDPSDAMEKNAPLWTESNWSPSIGAALVQPDSTIAWFKTKNVVLACAVLAMTVFASLQLCGKSGGARDGGGAERDRLLGGERRVEGFGFVRRGETSSDVERAAPPKPPPTPAPAPPTPAPAPTPTPTPAPAPAPTPKAPPPPQPSKPSDAPGPRRWKR